MLHAAWWIPTSIENKRDRREIPAAPRTPHTPRLQKDNDPMKTYHTNHAWDEFLGGRVVYYENHRRQA
jgi:hypothetical protein